jgi:hypothetical protein
MILTSQEKSLIQQLWFARWMAMCYSEVLNTETGDWYAEQLIYFNEVVYPQWLQKAKETYDLDVTLMQLEQQQKKYREKELNNDLNLLPRNI